MKILPLLQGFLTGGAIMIGAIIYKCFISQKIDHIWIVDIKTKERFCQSWPQYKRFGLNIDAVIFHTLNRKHVGTICPVKKYVTVLLLK